MLAREIWILSLGITLVIFLVIMPLISKALVIVMIAVIVNFMIMWYKQKNGVVEEGKQREVDN